MWSQAQWIEHINIVNDPRNNVPDDDLVKDEERMKVTWNHTHFITDAERDIPEVQALGDVDEVETSTEFPAKFEVCDLCDGKGKHVNPNIDAGGICEDDEFWDDDMDEETGESRYMRGDYDVPCNCCGGKRVVLTIDRAACTSDELKAALAEYDQHLRDEAEYEAERRAERRMGA